MAQAKHTPGGESAVTMEDLAKIAGLILLGQGSHGEAVRALQQTNLPLVVWGAPEADASYVVVGSDNRKGGASAAERFLEQGRRKLIFVGDVDHAEVQERCAGFID